MYHSPDLRRCKGNSERMQEARLLALDGLRGVSVGLVVASHLLSSLAGVNQVPGGLGVTIFFFISGFIIARYLLN